MTRQASSNSHTLPIHHRENIKPFITEESRSSKEYKEKKDLFINELKVLIGELNKNSIPFYSPRYSAHMCVDQSLPAIFGYLSTMFYNPNNVAYEASPFTTKLETEVGSQLCKMIGYQEGSWGHVTCDGTVANLESMW